MKFSAVLSTLFAVAAFASPVEKRQEAEVIPDPNQVHVKSVVANGSGCKPGSVQATFNGNRTIMTLIFSQYEATIGPQAKSRSDARKNCQINMLVSYPTGYQYSVVGVITRGYLDIDAGVTGEIVSHYYFSGAIENVASTATINGPYHASYSKNNDIETESALWSSCNTRDTLANINTDIRLISRNPQAGGLLTVDSIDANFKTLVQYKFKWRPQQDCNRKPKSRNNFAGHDAQPATMGMVDSTVVLGH